MLAIYHDAGYHKSSLSFYLPNLGCTVSLGSFKICKGFYINCFYLRIPTLRLQLHSWIFSLKSRLYIYSYWILILLLLLSILGPARIFLSWFDNSSQDMLTGNLKNLTSIALSKLLSRFSKYTFRTTLKIPTYWYTLSQYIYLGYYVSANSIINTMWKHFECFQLECIESLYMYGISSDLLIWKLLSKNRVFKFSVTF